MAEKNDVVIGYLNDLIETCKDGEKGFRTAAAAIGEKGESKLRTLFNVFAQQRAGFAAELQNEVLRLGGDPAREGHVTGAFHRGWINLKSLVTGSSEESIIAECEAGEDAAMRNYEAALKKAIPADLFAIVQSQYEQVKQAHDTVRALERASKV